jgi:ABC-type Mn2+/Zn2+ transport system ATPase subunit
MIFSVISEIKNYGTSVLNIKHDSLLSTSLVWNVFLLQQVPTYSGDMHESLHVKRLLKLSNPNDNWKGLIILSKIFKYQISQKYVQ